jgi:hypothetical protein
MPAPRNNGDGATLYAREGASVSIASNRSKPMSLCLLMTRGCLLNAIEQLVVPPGRGAGDTATSGDVPTMLKAKVWRRAPRLGLRKLGGLLALLLCLIRLRSLKRGCRSDGGVVARKTRRTIHWHGHRSLRLRTRPFQLRSAYQTPASLWCVNRTLGCLTLPCRGPAASVAAESFLPGSRTRTRTRHRTEAPILIA